MPPGAAIYPPVDPGIAAVDVDHVIESQPDLIRRIKLLAGTNDADFNTRYHSTIRRLAEHVQLLPASELDSHTGPGGLFRLCLEMAFFSAQSAEGVVFSGRGTAEDRRREEPRWRYAAFLAGLTCELHRCVTAMTVVDGGGRTWPSFNQPLTQWLDNGGTDRYFIRWTQGIVGPATTGLLVERIVSGANLQYLQDGSPRIVPSMMDVVAGTRSNDKSALAVVVEAVREKVLLRDRGIQPSHYGKATVGSHLEPHLLDAMRQLITNKKWVINERKARLWYAKSGLFLIWNRAAKEILEILSDASVVGVPQDVQTLLEILLASNVFVRDKDNSPYWMIIPPGEKAELVAVKFANPQVIFGTTIDEIAPLPTLDGQIPGVTKTEAPVASSPSSSPVQNGQGGEQVASSVDAAAPVANAPPPSAQEEGEPPPPPPPVKPGAAIPEVEPVVEQVKMPTAVAATLRPATREVVTAILTEYQAKRTQGVIGLVDHGLAIDIEYLTGFGVTLEDLLKNLQEAGWLYAPPEKPSKKLHQVVIGQKKVNAVIIKTVQARDAGFVA